MTTATVGLSGAIGSKLDAKKTGIDNDYIKRSKF